MKKAVHTFILLFFITDIFAQKILVKQREETIGSGNNPALAATIFEANISDIEKEWKSLMKDCDAKVTMGAEIFADNAKIKGLDNTCDVYARVKSVNEKESELQVAVDLGGAYLSKSHPAQLIRMENLLYDFALKITKDAIAQQIKEAEKKHKKLMREQENLAEEKLQLQKDIENYRKKISEAENEITENEKKQENKKQETENQKKAVEEIKEKFNSVK